MSDLSKEFAGNFIREVERRRTKPTKTRPRGALIRQVVLKCFNCSKEFTADLHNAKRTQQKHCSGSCHKRATETIEGGNEASPLYPRWLAMKQRCNNKNSPQFSDYGERGITIEKDMNDFILYYTYVTSLDGYDATKLDTLTLDRIDNNKGYTKGNLRWVTRATQTSNQRPNSRGSNKYTGVCWSKTHNKWVARVDFNGATYCSSTHQTEEEAVIARNNCITLNNLPHPIQQIIYS